MEVSLNMFRHKSSEDLPDPFDFGQEHNVVETEGSKSSRPRKKKTKKTEKNTEKLKRRTIEKSSGRMVPATDTLHRKKYMQNESQESPQLKKISASHSRMKKVKKITKKSATSGPLGKVNHPVSSSQLSDVSNCVISCKKIIPSEGVSPPARAFHSAAVAGSKIVFFAGKGSKLLRDFWTFDAILQKWEHPVVTGESPCSRYRATLTNVDEHALQLILYGGQRKNARICYDFFEISVQDGCFQSVGLSGCASPSFPFLSGHTAKYHKDKLYFFGGRHGAARKSNQLAAFYPQTRSWAFFPTVGNWPQARDSHCSVIVLDSLYIFGGHNGQNYLNDLWKFDTVNCVWTLLKPNGKVPSPRGDSAAISLSDRYILITHGRDEDSIFTSFFMFDTLLEIWQEIGTDGEKSLSRYGHSLSLVGKHLFMFGGFGYDETFGDIYQLSFQEPGEVPGEVPAIVPSSPTPCVNCVILEENLIEKVRAAEMKILETSQHADTETKKLKNSIFLLEAKIQELELEVEEEKMKNSIPPPSSSMNSSCDLIGKEQAELLSLEEIDSMIHTCEENIKVLDMAKGAVRNRENEKKIEQLASIEKAKEAALQEMDDRVAQMMKPVSDRPDLSPHWTEGTSGVLFRQFYLIPVIKRKDDYSCRTETSIQSGDDAFATEEWLLTRPTEWMTNPNWSKVETIATNSSREEVSSMVLSVKCDPSSFSERFLSIAQAMARIKFEIQVLWEHGLVALYRDSGISVLLELISDKQMIEVSYDFKDTPEDYRVMLYLDELLDHWNEVFSGFEWLKYAVHKDDQGEDLVPIQSIHLAMADSEDTVQSVTLCHTYEIAQIAPDLILPQKLQLKFGNDFQIGRQIGKGGFANIYEGKYKRKTVAVKMCNVKAPIISQFDSEEEKKKKETARHRAAVRAWRKFWHEVMMLYELVGEHHLLQLIGYSREPFCIVTSYLPHGDLYHLLGNEYQYRTIPYLASLRFALSAAEALKTLHSKCPPIIHNDFKSPNIFLDVKNQKTFNIDTYLGDFGCARRCFSPILSRRRLVANPGWLAPEQLASSEFTERVDVYSFGIYLHELLSRQHPFSEYRMKNKVQFEQKIISGLRPTIPEKWPLEYRNLIASCWDSDPNSRPSFHQIVECLKMAITLAPS